MAEIQHIGLNATFKGRRLSESVDQFRGIKYASIPARFEKAELVNSFDVVVDATEYG